MREDVVIHRLGRLPTRNDGATGSDARLGPALFDETEFLQLISGQRRGVGAGLCRAALRLLEVPYSAAVALRNRRFDRDRARVHQVGVPVVSVGNITTGGTGKTPTVAWLARWFRRRGIRVALVSRGYGASEGARNDEALELEQQLPDVPHLQNPDRVAAAATAIAEFESQLILLDDGFQHRRIHRDLDLVLIDALEPFGYGHLLPRGLLRESLRSLARADLLLISRSDVVPPAHRRAIEKQLADYAPQIPCLNTAHQPDHLLAWPDSHEPITRLEGKRVAAFCGIGNPEGFRRTLAGLGCTVAALRVFPDHHAYQRSDIEELSHWARPLDAQMLVCTQKDLVKLQVEQVGELPLRALMVGIEFLAGLESLERRLEELAERTQSLADR